MSILLMGLKVITRWICEEKKRGKKGERKERGLKVKRKIYRNFDGLNELILLFNVKIFGLFD